MIALNLRKVPDSLYKKLKQKWVEELPKSGFHAFVISILKKYVESE